jgi:hypothetical protein
MRRNVVFAGLKRWSRYILVTGVGLALAFEPACAAAARDENSYEEVVIGAFDGPAVAGANAIRARDLEEPRARGDVASVGSTLYLF